MNSEDGQVYYVYSVSLLQFSCFLSTTVCSQNINKQNVDIADETLTDYSFLSRYHYTKSKNYLKRPYLIPSLNSYVYWDTLYKNEAVCLTSLYSILKNDKIMLDIKILR